MTAMSEVMSSPKHGENTPQSQGGSDGPGEEPAARSWACGRRCLVPGHQQRALEAGLFGTQCTPRPRGCWFRPASSASPCLVVLPPILAARFKLHTHHGDRTP